MIIKYYIPEYETRNNARTIDLGPAPQTFMIPDLKSVEHIIRTKLIESIKQRWMDEELYQTFSNDEEINVITFDPTHKTDIFNKRYIVTVELMYKPTIIKSYSIKGEKVN